MQGKKQYQEKLFTNFQLSDHVPEDNFYRRLKEVLPLQWVYKATQKYYGTEGQQSIDPVVFFKLMLIGYFENLCSDRRVIMTVQLRLDMLFFISAAVGVLSFTRKPTLPPVSAAVWSPTNGIHP